MVYRLVLRKTVIPVSSSAFLAATVFAGDGKKEQEEKKELIRPKDLSIYRKPEEQKQSSTQTAETSDDNWLLPFVREVREAVWKVQDSLHDVKERVDKTIETGKAHTSTAIQTLREEDNYPHRYVAIATGGLVGLILARRRWFRRIIYTGVGATAVAAVCYPEEAKEYSSEGFKYVKKYIIVAYHFVNGVLRDYVGVQLPSLPGPLAIGSASAAEREVSTVPSSATLMPLPASAPSHISASGPIPLPPLDSPTSFADSSKKKG